MTKYYTGGGTPEATGDAKLFIAEFLGGFPDDYDFVDIEDGGYITKADPYWRFGEAGGDQVVEIGLWDDYRIRITDASGIQGWDEGESEWVDLLTGGEGGGTDVSPGVLEDHTVSGITSTFTAGENLVFGSFCYIKSDGKMWRADADATATMPIVAMATAIIAADAEGIFLMLGSARDDTWALTITGGMANIIYASLTLGGITSTMPTGAGDEVQPVGFASTATTIYFNPQLWIMRNTS